MMMSSRFRRPPRAWTVSSVTAPAGSIDQTARGPSPSFCARSSTDAAAVAPSLASSSRESAPREYTTQSWPAFIRRRTMLPPMRPSPIMPICMALSSRTSDQRTVDGVGQAAQTRLDVGTQIDAQHASPALFQHAEVALGLGLFDQAEAELAAWHAQVARRVVGDLDEDPAVRPALVGLAGGVQEARPEAQGRGGMGAVAQLAAQLLQSLGVLVAAIDI